MNDQLVFDVLLSTGGIRRPDRLFPPSDVESLQQLLDAIRDSSYDTLKKDCLIYYLLKSHKDGREEVYRDEKCIPPQFALLADAYWCLDTGINVPVRLISLCVWLSFLMFYQKAVSILSDVRLNRDYPSKVLQAISLSEDANLLILKYIRTAKPQLTEPIDIDIYTVALAESSLLEAWQFQRTFPESSETRPRLLHKILEWCLSRTQLSHPYFHQLTCGHCAALPRLEPLTQLLGFPFSDYEQNLIHKYTLQPPSSLSPSSIPIIQDLVCVRLIQSGQYSSAIKLDRRFAATLIPGATSKMQNAIQDRRKMMDELLNTLPAVEKELVEAELDAEASSENTVEKPFFGKSQRHSNGLTVSWEEAGPASAAANGSPTPTRSIPQNLPKFGAPPIVPISARNDMPRFGGSVNHPQTNGNIFIPVATSSSTSLHTQSHVPSLSRTDQTIPLSFSQNSRTPAPLLNSSGIKYPTPLFTQPSTSARVSLPNVKPGSSLFSMAGSANQTRNAFYTPPVTNGIKRSLGEHESHPAEAEPPARNPANEPPAPIVDSNDVNMDSEDEYTRDPDVTQANDTEDALPAELSYSVFGNKSAVKQPPLKSRRVTKTETDMKMPPGAYFPDEDEAAANVTSHQQRRSSPSPPPPLPIKQTRNTRAKKLIDEPDLKRSLPGSFMAEEEDEREDEIAPLPTSPPLSKRPARKARLSHSTEPEDPSAKPTRRSTRLSTASSITSNSPEPPSPQKTSGKIRKSTRSGGSAKSGSRKK